MTEIVRLYDRGTDGLEPQADVGPDGRLIRGGEDVASIATTFLEERSVDEILTYLDGPHLMATAIDVDDLDYDPGLQEKRVKEPSTARGFRLSKDWIRYRGPFGGEGWQHVETGDVRYVDDPPGDVAQEGQTQTTLDTGIEIQTEFEEPKWFNDEVGRVAVYEALGEEAYHQIIEYAQSDRITDWPPREIDNEFDLSGEMWLEGAGEWIEEHGNNRDVVALQQYLDNYNTTSPWGETEAPDHLNPQNAVSLKGLYETDVEPGVSADSMMVAEMESGDRVFLTNVNDSLPGEIDSSDALEAKIAKEASDFLTELGANVPEHHFEEGEFLAVAEADGTSIREYHRPRVRKREYIEFAAKQMLVGNTDAHTANVYYGFGGLQVIDLDLAVSNFKEQPNEVKWGLGKLYDTAVESGIYEPYSDDGLDRFLEELKSELEGWAESSQIEDALDAVDDADIRETFADNIEAARQGEIISENQTVNNQL